MVEDLRHLPPVRGLVLFDEESFPDEFRDMLEIKITGWREGERVLMGAVRRTLRPIWTLVPRDLDQLELDLRFPQTETTLNVMEILCYASGSLPPEPYRQSIRDHWRRLLEEERAEAMGYAPPKVRGAEDDRG